MAKVLVINGTSTPPDKAYSVALTNLYLEHYKQLNPNDEIINLDLNTEPMAQIALNRDNFSNFWNENDSKKYIEQLKEVDKVIMACPMNNFNISGLIKNYLDHVLLANELFSYKYSKKGDAIGLLTKLKVQILTTQGAPIGWYPFGNHTLNLEGTWKFCGAQINPSICLAGTKTDPLKDMSPVDAAKTLEQEVIAAVKSF